MHKKLASELTSLAHSVLQMKNKDNVFLLQKKAHEIYEKLSVLAYVEEYINSTPQATQTKEELLAKIEEIEQIKALKLELEAKQLEVAKITVTEQVNAVESSRLEDKLVVADTLNEDDISKRNLVEESEEPVDVIQEKPIAKPVVEEVIEQPFEELEGLMFGEDDGEKFNEASFIEETKNPTLEDELKDTISVDVTADLFTKVEPKKSLNDCLQDTIQIGLNDRIAFVKHLFNNDSLDFNRVVSQLNTLSTEKEAKKFINKTVKPDYDWSDKEEYEARFLEIIERRFA